MRICLDLQLSVSNNPRTDSRFELGPIVVRFLARTYSHRFLLGVPEKVTNPTLTAGMEIQKGRHSKERHKRECPKPWPDQYTVLSLGQGGILLST